jgi:DnaJ-class molecular chaperone
VIENMAKTCRKCGGSGDVFIDGHEPIECSLCGGFGVEEDGD